MPHSGGKELEYHPNANCISQSALTPLWCQATGCWRSPKTRKYQFWWPMHALVNGDSPVLRVRVLNTTEEEVKNYANIHIAIAEQVEVMDRPESAVTIQQGDSKKKEMLQRLMQAIEPELIIGEQDMFFQLLQQNVVSLFQHWQSWNAQISFCTKSTQNPQKQESTCLPFTTSLMRRSAQLL